MPDFAFRLMALMYAVRDRFTSPGDRLDSFGIVEGQTVVDYGCGTGSHIIRTSQLVGEKGLVYAIDIHELAIKAVERRIVRQNLKNVKAFLAREGACPLADKIADVIYALDMFHMVGDTNFFLMELHRITKPEGSLFIDDGHQSRRVSRDKVMRSGCWIIEKEEKGYMLLVPIKTIRS